MKTSCLLFVTASAFTALTTVGSSAHAQDSGQVAAAFLEDIVVTARKREESAQDIPVSVTAMSAEAMAQLQVETVVDVARYTPGFQMQPAFGSFNDRPVIRGASNLIVADGKVGVFIDGVPWFGALSTLDMDSFQRVEVMRGPQSALYGRGTLSGAVNMITRSPGSDLDGRASVTSGSDGRLDYSINLSGPVDDTLGFVAGLSHSEFGGQYQNEIGYREMLGARSSDTHNLGLYFRPEGGFEASLRYYGIKSEENQAAVSLMPASENNCYLTTRPYYCGTVKAPTSFRINTDRVASPGLERETHAVMGNVSYEFAESGARLSYLAGRSKTYLKTGLDLSYDDREFMLMGASCPFVPISNRDCSATVFNDTRAQNREAVTHELRFDGPAIGSLRWSVGGYYGADKTTPLRDFLEFTEVGPEVMEAIYEIENLAAFGGLEYDLRENLTLSLEGRWQKDTVTQTGQSYRVSDLFTPQQIAQLRNPLPSQVVGNTDSRTATFETFLPRVSVTWRPSADLNLYAQYAVGNSPGGFNVVTSPVATYDEERLTNTEIGAKTSLFGFRYLNMSLFHNVIDNQVLSSTFQTATATGSYMANIGETEVNGLEIEGLRYLTSGLSVRFAYTFLDTEITEGVDNDEAILHLGVACKSLVPGGTSYFVDLSRLGCLDAASIVGRRTPLVSEHSGSIGLKYEGTTNWNDVDWFVATDLTYVGSFFGQVHNLIKVPASQRVNLNAGLSFKDFQVNVWARNLLDDDSPIGALRYVDYGAAPVQSPGGDSPRGFPVSAAERRTMGVTLSVRF
ncbi:TonB-dependent receptor [uncultured Brevundimonas sp.]|uniref:TonB-dependent receptor n=1 Tax=uncultured Brevundimonas sp. TaxID=213418 RepID=UPI00261469B9|nr:TonB-dependent receptor [uncultured Brevundimonas sp.]